jgi:RNA polymerase sigma factor (sigma-70 family)
LERKPSKGPVPPHYSSVNSNILNLTLKDGFSLKRQVVDEPGSLDYLVSASTSHARQNIAFQPPLETLLAIWAGPLPFQIGADLREMNSAELLARYRDDTSEEAFAELVQRYADFVFSVAKRRLGRAELAEEAAQVVFLRLATTKPRLLNDHAVLGWLHRTAFHVSIDLLRAESRRRIREEKSMQNVQTDDEPVWHEIVPLLDEALDKLKDEERSILLLRFFERKAFAQVGAVFNISEDAAKMRTARALDKLRDLLVARKVLCTAAILGGLLLDRAVEAAPSGFSSKILASGVLEKGLQSKRSVRPSTTPSGQLLSRTIVIGTASLLLLGLLFKWSYRTGELSGAPVEANLAAPAVAAPSLSVPPSTRNVTVPRPRFDPGTTRFVITLLDSESGAPISGGRVSMAYFYAGGVGEGHNSLSDADGEAPIPFPDKEGTHGANIFVTADGYVPKVLSCRDPFPEKYEMKLDPAFTFAGQVVDPEGNAVENVKVTIECPAFEIDNRNVENVAFNSPETAAVSDTFGTFRLPYIPREIPPAVFSTNLTLNLSADGFEITKTNFPPPITPRTDLKLVIQRGFVVTGRVVDPQGQPLANVTVRESHNFGVRKLRTRTDDHGIYTLTGVFHVPFANQVRVVAEPEGWACQEKAVTLDAQTNIVDFTLAKSPQFRAKVIDENGLPLGEVTVRTDSDNEGLRKYEWLDLTDLGGYVQWTSAPAEPALFWFEKVGYETIRDRLLTPNGTEYVITLRQVGSTSQFPENANRPTVTYRFYEPPSHPRK